MGNNHPMTGDDAAVRAGVCVVIPACNAASTLAGAVRSALGDETVLQCVIVDDASDDETLEVARALAGGDPRVDLVVRDTRGGPAAARNDGLGVAQGGRICFLDADDELCDGAISALSSALAAHRGAVGALGRFVAVDAGGSSVDVGRWEGDQLHGVVRRKGKLIESPNGLDPEALVTRLVSPPPGAWLLDTATVRAIGGFDTSTRRSEDLELLVRLAGVGVLVTVERDVLRYLRHDAQRSAATAQRQWGRGMALWKMTRNASSARTARAISRGAAAYHLDLFATRWRAGGLANRSRALRNLTAACVARAAGPVAAALPRRTLRAVPGPGVSSVD